MSIPGHDKNDFARSCHDRVVTLLHEALNDELLEDPSLLQKVQESLAAGDWPPLYTEHPVVTSNPGETVVPIALYLDGVPTIKKDSVIGFWVYSLVSMKRHLCAVIRKSSLCKCGCRGWDSLFPIWQMLHWSFTVLRDGVFPSFRHDGAPFADDDPRSAVKGTPLAAKACLLYIKGDWAELSSTTGLPTWADNKAPCMFLHVPQGRHVQPLLLGSWVTTAWRRNRRGIRGGGGQL